MAKNEKQNPDKHESRNDTYETHNKGEGFWKADVKECQVCSHIFLINSGV